MDAAGRLLEIEPIQRTEPLKQGGYVVSGDTDQDMDSNGDDDANDVDGDGDDELEEEILKHQPANSVTLESRASQAAKFCSLAMHEVRPLAFSGASSKSFQLPKFSCFPAHRGGDSRASLVHHFGVGSTLLIELERSASRNSEVERFTDVFFDTPDRRLALSGMWLRRRSHESQTPVTYEWSLKISSVTADPQFEELLGVDETTDRQEIEDYLHSSGLPRLPDSELTMDPLVVIDFARFTVRRDDRSNVWIDCTRIGPHYYVLGGCSFRDSAGEEAVLTLTSHDGTSTNLDRHPDYLAPARTKVIEAIRYAHPALHKELIEKHVIPPGSHYLQAHAYVQPPDRFAAAFIHDDGDDD